MLPTHVFADVVGCLPLYDLDALLLTDTRCSSLAHSAASRIRAFDFSDYGFHVHNALVHVCKVADNAEVAVLTFLDETDLADFIPAALRNCVLGDLMLCTNSASDATRAVADTIVVTGTLVLFADLFVNVRALVELAVTFRSVTSVRVYDTAIWSDSLTEELVNLFDGHGFGQTQIGLLFFVNRSA